MKFHDAGKAYKQMAKELLAHPKHDVIYVEFKGVKEFSEWDIVMVTTLSSTMYNEYLNALDTLITRAAVAGNMFRIFQRENREITPKTEDDIFPIREITHNAKTLIEDVKALDNVI